MNDLGTALLLFGIFLAMLYVATGRRLYTVVGLGLFAAGSWAVYQMTPHVQERFHVWLDPWKTPTRPGTRSSSRSSRSPTAACSAPAWAAASSSPANGRRA